VAGPFIAILRFLYSSSETDFFVEGGVIDGGGDFREIFVGVESFGVSTDLRLVVDGGEDMRLGRGVGGEAFWKAPGREGLNARGSSSRRSRKRGGRVGDSIGGRLT
jgi:hypothetical protein